MSLGYASRLSYREDLGGQLGNPELNDCAQNVQLCVKKLAALVRQAERVVAFTGAGISTACGIPDFRGPSGVWTLQRAGKEPPKLGVSFTFAKPSLTHMVLVALQRAGKLVYVCSQNVDGLHLRSGLPRDQLAELHGNCFAERCERCKAEYVRDFEMESVGFKVTGRRCTAPRAKGGVCGGALRDHILDWEDGLPPKELKRSQQEASQADVSLCLGTSLQITPACNIPERALKRGGSLAIVNLQATDKDRKATLVVHSKVDVVMAALAAELALPVPRFERTSSVRVSIRVGSPATFGAGSTTASATGCDQRGGASGDDDEHGAADSEAALMASATVGDASPEGSASTSGGGDDGGGVVGAGGGGVVDGGGGGGGGVLGGGGVCGGAARGSWAFALSVESPHGRECALPMVAAVEVQFPGQPWLAPQQIEGPPPFELTRTVDAAQSRGAPVVRAQVRLLLVEAADVDKRTHEFDLLIRRRTSSQQPAPPALLGTGDHSNGNTARSGRSARGGGGGGAPTTPASPEAAVEESRVVTFVAQVQEYEAQQAALLQALEEEAAAERAAGILADPNAGQPPAAAPSTKRPRSAGGSAGGAAVAATSAPAAARYGETSVDPEGCEVGQSGPSSSGRVPKRAKRLDM